MILLHNVSLQFITDKEWGVEGKKQRERERGGGGDR